MDYKDAVEKIKEIRQWINERDHWRNPARLGESVDKLATLNAWVGDKLHELHREARLAEIKGYQSARQSGASQGDASVAGRKAAVEAKAAYEEAEMTYKTTKDIISARQTNIKTIMEEYKNG